MNINTIIEYLTKGVTGGATLFIIVKLANALSGTFKVGKNWINSTSPKGIIYKIGVGFVLVTVLPTVSNFVSTLMANARNLTNT
jgi:hypothetical protein